MSVCVITGAGSGIGRAVAVELGRLGYYDTFAMLGRNIPAIMETIEIMKTTYGRGGVFILY